jgi:Flp pilus assembly protein TadD
MHFDKQFFKKTGYKVTDEPIQPEPRPKALLAYFERFNEEARNPRPGTVAAIRKAISEFPGNPTLYNNLYMALEQSNQPAEARTVLRGHGNERARAHITYCGWCTYGS